MKPDVRDIFYVLFKWIDRELCTDEGRERVIGC